MTAEGAPRLSVLIPAHDEGAWIGACLDALLASKGALPAREVLVIANACRDDTVAQAQSRTEAARAAGWELRVIETPEPGKLHALNLGDGAARGDLRLYLDADVTVSAGLVAQVLHVLDRPGPAYATGSPRIARSPSAVTRAYARFWQRLPFVARGTPGFGCFAVNAAGRQQWSDWPDIIADDMFARLSFASGDRHRVEAVYDWPPVDGFANLVRVRRRQDAGVAQLARVFPALLANEDKARTTPGLIARLALRDPLGFVAYAGVALATRLPVFRGSGWVRGR